MAGTAQMELMTEVSDARTQSKKPIAMDGLLCIKMEREKRLELSTYTLARYRSTN